MSLNFHGGVSFLVLFCFAVTLKFNAGWFGVSEYTDVCTGLLLGKKSRSNSVSKTLNAWQSLDGVTLERYFE